MGLRGNPATQLELDPLEAALAVLEAVTATDAELAAAVATLTAGIALKQDAATAASDAELSAAVATLNATMSTDAELAAAVANVNTALGLKQDALTAATDAELAAAVAAINTALAAKQDAATAATDAEVTSLLAPVTTHIANTANPHAVTKAQVGLALVDNTPDTGKPVSVAQQAAIDADRARLLSVESGQASGAGIALLDASGHSYMLSAGEALHEQYGFVENVARQLGAREVRNLGVPGSQVAQSPLDVFGGANPANGGWGWILRQVKRPGTPPAGESWLPQSAVVLGGWGLNDTGYQAIIGTTNLRPMIEGLRTILTRYCAAAVYENVDPAWVFTGTWVENPSANASGVSYHHSTTAGDKATLTLPASYPGALVVSLGIVNVPGNNLILGVKIDGVARADVPIAASGIGAGEFFANELTLRYGRGVAGDPLLSSGTHTFELTIKTPGFYGLVGVDCATVEADPLDGPVIIGLLPCRAWNVAIAAGIPEAPFEALLPASKAALIALYAEFGSRTIVVDIDTVLNKQAVNFNTDPTDSIHPSALGNARMTAQIIAACRAAGVPTARQIARPRVIPRPRFRVIGAEVDAVTSWFENSWVSVGGSYLPAAYARSLDGRIRLRGAVKSGSAATAIITTLPLGYRPDVTVTVATMVYTGAVWQPAVLQILPSGAVSFVTGASTAGAAVNLLTCEFQAVA